MPDMGYSIITVEVQMERINLRIDGMTCGHCVSSVKQALEKAGARVERVDIGSADVSSLGVDPEIKSRNLKRLRRIEGQVRGLQKMIDEDRYCADIMVQISSVNEALRAVGKEFMRNHLKHCATSAIRSGEDEASVMYDEIVNLMYRSGR